MPSFTTSLEQAIHAALALANEPRHELATLEHLLLALTEEPDAVRVMRACKRFCCVPCNCRRRPEACSFTPRASDSF